MNGDEPHTRDGRRSGRRSSEPLQHIGIGGGRGESRQERGDEDVGIEDGDTTELELETDPGSALDAEPAEDERKDAASRTGSRRPRARVVRSRASSRRRASSPRLVGLDRIRPRTGTPAAESPDGPARSEPSGRDPLGRAALYSSGEHREQPLFGTFTVECSACRRETPVTAGDLIRLGIPSLHFPFVKRYPSLMRCPSCGRRTWLRIRWRL